MMISEKHTWNILGDFFKRKGLVSHQIESFNHYIDVSIPRILKEEPDIVIENKDFTYRVSFDDVYIPSPTIMEEDRTLRAAFPSEIRRRDLMYDSPIYTNVTETMEQKGKEPEVTVHKRVVIGRTPIMLRSSRCHLTKCTPEERIEAGECEYDQGGYFIVRGKERVLISQLRGIYNKTLVVPQKTGSKLSYIAEVRSMSEETGHSVLVQVMIGNDNRTLVFSLPYIKDNIPVGVVFKALGFTDENEIKNFIGLGEIDEANQYIKLILRDSYFIQSQDAALKYIGESAVHTIKDTEKRNYAWQVVESELFPHMGITASVKEKAYFIGHMINRLISTHLGMRQDDDRDNYINKRVETAGILCSDLFRTLFKRYTSIISMQLEKKKHHPDAMSIISRLNTITVGLKHCFSTGNWGVQKNSYIRAGVSQVLSRLTYGASLSHLRRLMMQCGKEGKNFKIRQINPSQIMFLCPAETPEGQSVGIVLNFSLLTKVSVRTPTVLVKEILEDAENMINIESYEGTNNKTKVFLNGILSGIADDPDELVEEIKMFRSCGMLPSDVSISYDDIDEEINIYCDEGRLLRPVFTVEDNQLCIKESDGTNWDELVDKGVIKYVDNSEINNAVVAFYPSELEKYHNDYCEIAPAMMLGVMASIIPFPDHSQSPRNCYQCLDPNELVVMADGTNKAIKDIKIGDSVITVDPSTCKQTTTKVINQYVRTTDKNIITLRTESGRQITCTDDHPVLTSEGWKMAKDADNVCIIPQQIRYSNEGGVDLVVKLPNSNKTTKHMSDLKMKGLMPVPTNLLPTFARIVGFLLTDGSAGLYSKGPQVQFTFGSMESCEDFLTDVNSLGFNTNKMVPVYDEIYGHCYQVIYNNSFASLLIGLIDSYTGKRTEQFRPAMMNWIMYGTNEVKREFLAGFQGGDGCKFSYNRLNCRKSGNFILNSTSQTIMEEYIVSLTSYMIQVQNLFQEFGIECDVRVQSSKTLGSKVVHLYFSNTRENLINYFERIGWRYDNYKYQESLPIYEYQKYCMNTILNSHPAFPEWKRVTKDKAIFVRITDRIKETNRMIADITTESKNHSFIAGDSFCVHNSSMGKQAMGMFALSHLIRADTVVHVLSNPQKPIVSSQISRFMGFDDMPSGINAIVAIACYGG